MNSENVWKSKIVRIPLKAYHGHPVITSSLDLEGLVCVAHHLTGARAKTIYVHPKVHEIMLQAVDGADLGLICGVPIVGSFAVPIWALCVSDDERMSQLFDYTTGRPINLRGPV